MELDEDDELAVTEDEFAQECTEVPQMMEHAGMWDHFLAYVEAAEKPWAKPEADTDDYRNIPQGARRRLLQSWRTYTGIDSCSLCSLFIVVFNSWGPFC
eukprot:2289936-Pleurochrysis_carterae.AAC.1